MLQQADWNQNSEVVNAGQSEPEKGGLGVVLIGPNDRYRDQASQPLALSHHVVKQVPYYPTRDQISTISAMGLKVFLLDVDSNPEAALALITSFSQTNDGFVMAMTNSPSTELVKRCMQAGAREILTVPLTQDELDEAMARAHARIFASPGTTLGSLCVFIGAKGGAGTTTIASNFAIAAALSEKRALLIDFDLPLGDAILGFGVRSEFSTLDALQSHHRLDATLLTHYLALHESGLFILPAPGKYLRSEMTKEAIDKLIQVARQGFDCVVLDAGTRFDLTDTAICHPEAQIYLVSQPSIADLRNVNRILSQFDSGANPRNVQLVLNRNTSVSSIDEEPLDEVLTQPVQWRVPNDFKAVREMQNSGVPIAMNDSPITRAIRQMAQEGLNLPPEQDKKKKKRLWLF